MEIIDSNMDDFNYLINKMDIKNNTLKDIFIDMSKKLGIIVSEYDNDDKNRGQS